MAEANGTLQVQVCYAASAETQFLRQVMLPDGALLEQAIRESGVLQQFPEIDLTVCRVGIYGKLKILDTPLREQDRVEIYRPLTADPKDARRRRVTGG